MLSTTSAVCLVLEFEESELLLSIVINVSSFKNTTIVALHEGIDEDGVASIETGFPADAAPSHVVVVRTYPR